MTEFRAAEHYGLEEDRYLLAPFPLVRGRGYRDLAVTGSRAVVILAECLTRLARKCVIRLYIDAVF